MKPLLWGLSRISSGLAKAHQGLYDHGFLKAQGVSRPVISIGNLTMGGTGKTPITSFCLKLIQSRGLRPGLVVRSYRGSLKAPARVPQTGGAGVYGDEALWYAQNFADIPVWSGPHKTSTALELLTAESVDLVLVDDGFQHRALSRDLNILILDSTDPLSAYETFPLGRAREGREALERADVIIWSKWEESLSEEPFSTPSGVPVFHFSAGLTHPLPDGKSLVVSAIGRPESFFHLITRNRNPSDFVRREFRDHHPYSAEDVQKILQEARVFGARQILTTEKDAVKLRPLWNASDLPLLALPLEVRPIESVESFYEVLCRALRSRV